MSNTPLISIIIPAYNAEKYLGECLRSIAGQTYANIEVVLVDDGSTDSTASVGREWEQKDRRIRYIRTENAGVSAARNTGIDMARGEWIGFVDADDFIDPGFVEILIGNAQRYGADISSARFDVYHKNAYRKRVKQSRNRVMCMSATDAIADVLYQKHLDNSPCNKIYRSELWRDVRFTTGSRYEDLDVFYRVFERADRVAFTPLALYHYRQHSDSYMHKFDSSHSVVLDVTAGISAYMSDRCPQLLQAAHDRELSANFNILVLMYGNGMEDEAVSDRCWNRIVQLRHGSLTDRNVRLKNKIGIIASYLGGRRLLKLLSYVY